jgi:hypothetical protein
MFGRAAHDPNTSTYKVLIDPPMTRTHHHKSFTSHGRAGRLVFRNLRVNHKRGYGNADVLGSGAAHPHMLKNVVRNNHGPTTTTPCGRRRVVVVVIPVLLVVVVVVVVAAIVVVVVAINTLVVVVVVAVPVVVVVVVVVLVVVVV